MTVNPTKREAAEMLAVGAAVLLLGIVIGLTLSMEVLDKQAALVGARYPPSLYDQLKNIGRQVTAAAVACGLVAVVSQRLRQE
jgi:hypothetical protein